MVTRDKLAYVQRRKGGWDNWGTQASSYPWLAPADLGQGCTEVEGLLEAAPGLARFVRQLLAPVHVAVVLALDLVGALLARLLLGRLGLGPAAARSPPAQLVLLRLQYRGQLGIRVLRVLALLALALLLLGRLCRDLDLAAVYRFTIIVAVDVAVRLALRGGLGGGRLFFGGGLGGCEGIESGLYEIFNGRLCDIASVSARVRKREGRRAK